MAGDVLEDLGGGLTRANDSDLEGSVAVAEDARRESPVLRRVDDARVLLREGLGDLWVTSYSYDDTLRAAEAELVCVDVARCDLPCCYALGALAVRRDIDNLVSVRDQVLEPASTPAQVILVLDATGQESAQVGELDQAVVLVEVVEEGELAARVAHCGHVLDEGDLHLCARNLHTSVPCEALLSLEEGNLGLRLECGLLLASLLGRVVEGYCNCQ